MSEETPQREGIISFFIQIKGKQWFDLVVIVLIVSSIIYVSTLMFSSMVTNASSHNAVFAGRDFSKSPFELLDAHTACMHSAKTKHGKNLLRAHMDELSTRYDPVKGQYFVVLIAWLEL